MTETSQARAPAAFKSFNRFMLLLWRLGLGGLINGAPECFGRIMVLDHCGRTSGLRRRTPVNYALVDGDLFCAVGFATTDWYRNVRADPNVEVWLPDGWWAGVAEELPREHPDWLPRLRQVLLASGLAAQQVTGVDVRTLDDTELLTRTTAYRVLRIRRTAARTGPGGPGELAWVWPLVMLPFGVLAVRLRRRTSR